MRKEAIAYGPTLWPTLAPVWKELGASDASVFLSVEWVGSWVAAFGRHVRPVGLVWHDADNRLVGCALFSIGTGRVGPFPVRRAYLNASGFGVGCEHNDILCLPDYRQAVLDDLISVVAGADVDELALVGVREDLYLDLWARWPEPAQEGHPSESPYVDLRRIRSLGTSYIEHLSPNTRSQIRRATRLYENRFGIPEVRGARSVDEMREWFDDMVSLHARRWRDLGQPGAFEEPAVRAFHLELLERPFLEEGWELEPEILRVAFGSQAIAFLYQLRYRGRVNFYQSGLAYHDDNRLKPGLVAHALAVDHYLALGESEYDFLGGEPEGVRYKQSLATDRRTLAWIELPSPTLKMRILRTVRLARRGLRSLMSNA